MTKPMSEQMQKVASRYEKATGKKFGQKTNADHIRSMSDEDLASVIMCPYDVEPDLCYSRKSCYACSLEWLQQPYKEDA